MSVAIKFENISKQYRLGLVSTNTISHDLNRFWKMNVLRQEDPYLKIGEVNDRAHKGNSDYVWALKDINFEVEQGDVLGIIGKNGAGKSTLLKILSKVTAPTTGTIKARGRIASLLEVGTGFHPEMTGRENIYMNGAIMGMTKAEITRKLDEIVDFSGVERYLDTPVKRYSSGMTVRLGFAIAAHLEPEILVVDEVLAVGDAEFQKKAIGKMQDVSKGEGRTVLFVSHNMSAVRSLCNKGIVLENGFVNFAGNVDLSISKYLTESNLDNNSKIINKIVKCNTNFIIKKVKINNSENLYHKITNDNLNIDVYISGFLNESTKIALEMYFFDENEFPLAIYNPSINHLNIREYEKGDFEINEVLKLPHNIITGKYKLAISLTNPNVEGFVDIDKSIILDIDGFISSTGLHFDYNRGHGWLFLN